MNEHKQSQTRVIPSRMGAITVLEQMDKIQYQLAPTKTFMVLIEVFLVDLSPLRSKFTILAKNISRKCDRRIEFVKECFLCTLGMCNAAQKISRKSKKKLRRSERFCVGDFSDSQAKISSNSG